MNVPGVVLMSWFLYPMVLWALAAAAAPILIHLLNRRRYREVPWAAMQYLLEAVRKNSRRMQFEQWLLLAVRTLIVILVVLAVAEPVLEQVGLPLGPGQRAHRMFVVDASFSMAFQADEPSRWDRARDGVRRIVEQSGEGDGFTLLLLADPPRVVIGEPSFQPDEFLKELDNLRLPHGRADLPATLARIEQTLAAVRKSHPRLAREEVFLITDLGRNTWAPELRDEALGEFRARSERLGQQTQLVVVDLGSDNRENLAVTRTQVLEPYATTAAQITLEAEVRNFGAIDRAARLVEFYVDNNRTGEQSIDLPAGGQATVRFAHRFESPGEHVVEVRVGGDYLDVDNHRWQVVPVAEQLRVLCVDGRPGGGDFRGAADYLAVALAPGRDDARRGAVRVDVVGESALVETDLDPYDAIFLADVAQFTPSEARILANYLSTGGGVVFFLGDEVQADSYNRILAGEGGGPRVLPARLGDKVAEAQYAFDPLDYRHPLVAAFRGQEQAGLLTSPVYRYFQLDASDNPDARVALAFEGGHPAIVEATVGHGRSIVVATSADLSWTTMPVWPSYVPVVQELLAFAVEGRAADRNQAVGDALGGLGRLPAAPAEWTIRPPGIDPVTVRAVTEGDWNRWTFADTFTSGVYRAAPAGRDDRELLFALNVDPRESDLARLPMDELRTQVWPGVRFVGQSNWAEPGADAGGPLLEAKSWHQFLLAAVVGLLLFESFLAWFLARRAV